MIWPLRRSVAANVSNEMSEPMGIGDLLRAMMGGLTTASGVEVTKSAAERLAAVASCVRVLSDDVAALPLILMQEDGAARSEAKTNPLYLVLKLRPNPIATAFEFRQQMMRDKLLTGNAYAYAIRNWSGDVVELWRMLPETVSVEQDSQTLALRYRYTRPNGNVVVLSQSDVLHLRGPSHDGITGLSPIALYRETIGDGIAMREHGSRVFGNGAFPGGALELEGRIDEATRRALREDFAAIHRGSGAHRTAILPAGIRYKPLMISMQDAQYLETRKFNRTEIAGIFGVPPHKIGDLDKATFSNISQQGQEYLNGSLLPHLVGLEQAIHRDLIKKPDLYCRHNVDALLRGDAKSRNEALKIQRDAGVISANEWRALEDLNPRTDPAGDMYIIPANMRPDDGSQMPIKTGGAGA